jgi:hypothetical protein
LHDGEKWPEEERIQSKGSTSMGEQIGWETTEVRDGDQQLQKPSPCSGMKFQVVNEWWQTPGTLSKLSIPVK